MDYDIYRDIYGCQQVRLSMGHEALGLWLTEEVGTDQGLISELLARVEQLKNSECWESHQQGREFVMTMTPDGVEVRATLLDGHDDEVAEGLSHYDQESECSCGLDDFAQLLEAWQVFTAMA